MNKNTPLILVLVTAVVILGGVVYWQAGQRDCEKRLGPIVETRFMPVKGCLVRLGDEWRSEENIKSSIREGVQKIQEGNKKIMEGIFGKTK